jgi:archaellum biogenesis ATPase FlaH
MTIIDDTLPGTLAIKERLKSNGDILKRSHDCCRFLLVGNPGQGKSVFCAKIAHDWCKKEPLSALKHTKLLFILQLGMINHETDIEDAIKYQLLQSISIDKTKLGRILNDFSDTSLIVLDSYDETEMGILGKRENMGNIVKIIENDYLVKSRVLITSRPWREGEIISQYSMYKRLQLKALSKSEILDLVSKFFKRREDDFSLIDLGKRLSKNIQDNKILMDMSCPLLTIMVCSLFEDTKGAAIPNRLGELYLAFFSMLCKSSRSHLKTVSNIFAFIIIHYKYVKLHLP